MGPTLQTVPSSSEANADHSEQRLMCEVWIAAYILPQTRYRYSVHAVNPFSASLFGAGKRSKNSVVSLAADEFGFPCPLRRYRTLREENAASHPMTIDEV